MANQKNQGGRQQPKQDKRPAEQPMREPMRKPEEAGSEEGQRDRSSNREKGDVDSGSVIENDEEVELSPDDLQDDDEESNQITGRHQSQRDRDLK